MASACNIDLYCGNAGAAARRLAEAWPDLERHGLLRIQQMRVELELLRARVTLADTARPAEERARLVRAIADSLADEGAPWASALAACARAGAAALRGDRAAARSLLVTADGELRAADMAGWSEIVRLRRAELDGSDGDARAAREQLAGAGAADPDAIAAALLPWHQNA
jgi:ATP/maltotriose-dependent transcriptional regulator MalT